MNKEECIQQTLEHRTVVGGNIYLIIRALVNRAINHDESKLREPELSAFVEMTEALSSVEYGSNEYRAQLASHKGAVDHHYQNNRHHPEYHENGIYDMNLVDIIEMVADWIAAAERVKNGDIEKSLSVNSKRFEIDSQLMAVIRNTVKFIKEE